MATAVQTVERENYLNSNYGIKSWLLTTDHKRIAVLYLISITVMFWIGGFFAMMIRLELLTPAGDLVSSDTYNKLFTMHGIIMVFFFLIPSVPAVLGNFLIPLMVGAKDLAFPRVNLLSWYLYIIGGATALVAMITGGVDTGWTFYTPFSTTYSNTHVIGAARRHLHHRFLLDSYRAELHRHHPPHARAGPDVAPFAAVLLVELRCRPHHDPGDAGNRHHAVAGGVRARLPHRRVQSGAGRRSASVPAPVLVLFPPRGLHHDSAGHGRDQRDHHLLLAQARLRIRVRRAGLHRHRRARVPGLGAPHVCRRNFGLRRAGVLAAELPGRNPVGGEGLQLDGDPIQGLHPLRDADAVRLRLHRPVHHRRPDRRVSGFARRGRTRHRHLLRGGALPLRDGRRHGDGLHGGTALLVAEDYRPHVSRRRGPSFRRCWCSSDSTPRSSRSSFLATWVRRAAITPIRRSSRC